MQTNVLLWTGSGLNSLRQTMCSSASLSMAPKRSMNGGAAKEPMNRFVRGGDLIAGAGVKFNILSVVTADLARSIREVYAEYQRRGFHYLQFIHCLDPLGEIPGKHAYSLTPDLYANFLKTLFDLWYRDLLNGRQIYIRDFNDIAGRLLGRQPDCCNLNGFCSMQNVIEADGSVYPCDFYVLDRYKIGNFAHEDAVALFKKGMESEFVLSSHEQSEECRQCQYYALCRGGCRRTDCPGGRFGRESPLLCLQIVLRVCTEPLYPYCEMDGHLRISRRSRCQAAEI